MTESNRPNEYGFAGGATAPEPTSAHPDARSGEASREGEDIAVPAGDLTGAISDAISNDTHGDDAPGDDADRH